MAILAAAGANMMRRNRGRATAGAGGGRGARSVAADLGVVVRAALAGRLERCRERDAGRRVTLPGEAHRRVPPSVLVRLGRRADRRPSHIACALLGLALALAAAPATGQGTPPAAAETPASSIEAAEMGRFLDRLMMAESGGRDTAANPRSTALGPFQFIESTFLEVARRHFAAETGQLAPAQVLALRTNRPFARRAAEAYTRDNAASLASAGLAATFANLRLAFLVGPGGAIRILRAERETPAIRILGANVVQANPFMAGMTAGDLTVWSERNLAASDVAGRKLAVAPGSLPPTRPPRPAIGVRCNKALASCRRWVLLATKRLESRIATVRGGRRQTPR
jgi:hypothetical protein